MEPPNTKNYRKAVNKNNEHDYLFRDNVSSMCNIIDCDNIEDINTYILIGCSIREDDIWTALDDTFGPLENLQALHYDLVVVLKMSQYEDVSRQRPKEIVFKIG